MRPVAAALSLFALLSLASSAVGQSPGNLNTTKLSNLDEHNAYNDIWGYTAPDGREYACVGTTDGIVIINCTDPVAPYETGFFPGGLCTWRDLKTFGTYLYVVTDCQGGVDVVDMSDPENPLYANKFGLGVIQHAHNVAIDSDTGILYAVGTQSGMFVYNLNANPINPPLLDTWGPKYIHDISIQDGMAHAALIYEGDYAILNVSNPSNVQSIGSTPSGAQFTHATWPNENNSLVVAADETPGNRHLAFYDTSDPNNPTQISKYTENKMSIPHNPFLKDDICHVSWYTEGYIAIDVSDPANPVKIGRFDTQPGTEPGGLASFDGAWGCYPFSPSGYIYVSDRSRGLFILSLNECSMDLVDQPFPQVCKVWPDTVSALDSPRQRIILTGSGFQGTTSVSVGGTVLSAADYIVKGDQVIHFRMPLVSAAGFNDITVSGPGGASPVAQIEVQLPSGGPVLDTGDVQQPIGDTLLVAIGSQPGDLIFPAVSFTQSPSVVPGKVAFDIGNNFSDLFLLPSLVANGAGVTGFTTVIPAAGLGVTVYWQAAVVDPQQGLPASVTPVTTTMIVDAN
ncbi:MAG: choice-of-anchor B domain-containing protein [Pseudohongiellaceae bacterium]|jgi:choice-of-anchor B domain-containing protein